MLKNKTKKPVSWCQFVKKKNLTTAKLLTINTQSHGYQYVYSFIYSFNGAGTVSSSNLATLNIKEKSFTPNLLG